MIRTHHNARTFKEAMIDYLTSDKVDADATIWDDQSGEELKMFGRRIIHKTAYGDTEYLKFDTRQEAEKEFDRLSFPATGDSVIYESFDRPEPERYMVFFNDGYREDFEDAETFETKEAAIFRLAQLMIKNGEFPPAWFVSDYGTYESIDDEVRSFHDEGGDKMKVSA